MLTRFMWWWLFRYIHRLACLHTCKFKEAGSNFHWVHIHVLRDGGYPAVSNPRKYTGLGHDDETDVDDPHHNTVSGPDGCEFMTPAEVPPHQWMDGPPNPKEGISPVDLQAQSPMDICLGVPDAEGRCPEGFWALHCECGEFCLTMNRRAWDAWYKSLHPH